MFNHNRDFLKSQGTTRPADLRAAQCPQCGADIELLPGRVLRTCPYCGSVLSVSGLAEVRKWLVRPQLSHNDCFRLLSAWLWENYRGAASGPEITGKQWMAWRYGPPSDHRAGAAWTAEPRDPGLFPEFRGSRLPMGQHLPFSAEEAGGFDLPPSRAPDGERTVYLPVYVAAFRAEGTVQRAVIEAATGAVRGALPKSRDLRRRRWTGFGIAALLLALEAFLIPGLTARIIAMGATFAAANVVLGLVWEGLLWRR